MKKLLVNHQRKGFNQALCLFCNETEVLQKDWAKRCKNCKAKQRLIDEQEINAINMGIIKRQPAAIIDVLDKEEHSTGEQVYVDKFGREVDNPGYDLKNDPRGWKTTGALKKEKGEMIS